MMDDMKSLVDRIRNAKKKYQDGVSKLYAYHCFLHPGSRELGFLEYDTNSGPDVFLNKQRILFDELNEEIELICRDLED